VDKNATKLTSQNTSRQAVEGYYSTAQKINRLAKFPSSGGVASGRGGLFFEIRVGLNLEM